MGGNMHIEANAVIGSFPIWNWNYNSVEKNKYWREILISDIEIGRCGKGKKLNKPFLCLFSKTVF